MTRTTLVVICSCPHLVRGWFCRGSPQIIWLKSAATYECAYNELLKCVQDRLTFTWPLTSCAPYKRIHQPHHVFKPTNKAALTPKQPSTALFAFIDYQTMLLCCVKSLHFGATKHLGFCKTSDTNLTSKICETKGATAMQCYKSGHNIIQIKYVDHNGKTLMFTVSFESFVYFVNCPMFCPWDITSNQDTSCTIMLGQCVSVFLSSV